MVSKTYCSHPYTYNSLMLNGTLWFFNHIFPCPSAGPISVRLKYTIVKVHVRANLTRVTSLPNSTQRGFTSYLLLYFLFIFYFPWCTLPNFILFLVLPWLIWHFYPVIKQQQRNWGTRNRMSDIHQQMVIVWKNIYHSLSLFYIGGFIILLYFIEDS